MSKSASDSDLPVALITGGSAGLGLVIAETFLRAGYHVIVVGRSPDRLESATRHLQSAATSAVTALTCDLSDQAAVKQLAEVVGSRFGRLDVLVNNVGESDRGLVSELPAERLRRLFERNVITTLLCSQAMLPMLEESAGSVVNIGSLAGKVGARYLGGYVAAKHALSGMTQQMRLEWREKAIHVALLSPGPIRREDSGTRYDGRSGDSLPDRAAKPGGGARVKGLDPQRVADAALQCARRERTDVILPGYLRCLIAIGNAAPRLGDWLLLKFTS